MATKAELLAKAGELGLEGLTTANSAKEISEAIKAKEAQIAAVAGGDEPETQEGFTKHKILTNVMHNGVSYLKGDRAMLSPMDVELFRSKGFIATPDEDEESDEDAQPVKAKGSDKGDEEGLDEEGADDQETGDEEVEE